MTESGPYAYQNRGPSELDRVTIPFPPNLFFVFVAYFIRAERESSLLTNYWSGSTDVFGVPASRHGRLNPLF